MFGISFEELVVLLVLAFLLFGPQKLPEYAATLGRFVAKIRQAGSEVTRQYQNPFQYPPEPTPTPTPTPTATPPAAASICPACGHQVSLDFIFCPACGHRLKEGHYPASSQPPLAS